MKSKKKWCKYSISTKVRELGLMYVDDSSEGKKKQEQRSGFKD